MTVREDRFTRPDGSQGLYGVVEKPDFALIIPVDLDGLWLVEQLRYPVGARHWEFPQGSWEDDPGVDPAALAAAELAEETGLRAGTWTFLARFYPAYGYADQGCRAWVATDLSQGPAARSVEEQDLVARKVRWAEWDRMLAAGEIVDGSSLAAWALLRAHPTLNGLVRTVG
ncbi:NUDIX hydrolase [Frankia sp. CNm7]|nr:NUDIX hydrolase [Frankia nepalensis]MBL7515996.1 NUDIX hydrolase [Frankia nepalensis]MBL7520198.1 NUDIX hydrolase [Frankia nepalensis]